MRLSSSHLGEIWLLILSGEFPGVCGQETRAGGNLIRRVRSEGFGEMCRRAPGGGKEEGQTRSDARLVCRYLTGLMTSPSTNADFLLDHLAFRLLQSETTAAN